MSTTLTAILKRLSIRATRGELNERELEALARALQRSRGEREVTRHNRPFFLYR